MRQSSRKVRGTHPKVAAEKAHDTHRKIAPTVAPQKARHARRVIDPFEEFRDTQLPESMRDLAERNIAQTRDFYQRSKSALRAVLASWEKSFGAVGQGAVAFNHTIMDIAERNITAGFDLAASLAGAKNLAEAMTLQADCWRKHFLDLNAQAEEVRRLAAKLTADVTTPIEGKVTLGRNASAGRVKSSYQ
jgi:hypothetical protein